MKYQSYPAYKDSGVEWLGKIPEGWRSLRFGLVVAICNGADYKAIESDETGIPVFGSGGQFAFASRAIHTHPSVLLGRKGTIDRPLFVDVPFWTSDTMFYTVCGSEVFPKFVFFFANMIPFGMYQTNTALPSMTQTDYGSMQFPLPPLPTQKAIAAFLDTVTARIDGLVKDYEELITLLQEKRQALISHAVTRGLSELVSPDDPDFSEWAKPVNLKDSGVEWLGQIPEGWEAVQFRRIIQSFEQGWSPECEAQPAEDNEWGVLKAGCVNNGFFNELENKALPDSLSPREALEIHDGDVLMSRASGSPKLIGSVACITRPRARLMLSDKIFRIRLHPYVHPPFFARQMGSTPLRTQIELSIGGAEGLANNLPQSSIKEYWLAVPENREQKAIVTFLDKETAKMDTLVAEAQSAIELLKEHRSALITNAVTGKINVEAYCAMGDLK